MVVQCVFGMVDNMQEFKLHKVVSYTGNNESQGYVLLLAQLNQLWVTVHMSTETLT